MMHVIADVVASRRSDALNHTLAGKLRRMALFPNFTLTTRGIAQAVHSARTAYASHKIARLGLDALIRRVDGEALEQDPADLLFLYENARDRRPQRAIEFGSGQSTTFIAQGLHDAGGGHLWSLDGNARWLANTEATLPDHLRPYVTFVHSPLTVTEEHGPAAWRYSIIPPGTWDFVFLDGPTLTDDVKLSCDLIEIADRFNPGAFGMIDHRWRTAVLAREMTRLRLHYRPSLESFTFTTPAPAR
jgi:predicted O-methyltransferase YrrM